MVDMDVADFLLSYKNEQNIGYKKLAKLSGINERALRTIIKREVKPSAKTCYKIAQLTDKPVSVILSINNNWKDKLDE